MVVSAGWDRRAASGLLQRAPRWADCRPRLPRDLVPRYPGLLSRDLGDLAASRDGLLLDGRRRAHRPAWTRDRPRPGGEPVHPLAAVVAAFRLGGGRPPRSDEPRPFLGAGRLGRFPRGRRRGAADPAPHRRGPLRRKPLVELTPSLVGLGRPPLLRRDDGLVLRSPAPPPRSYSSRFSLCSGSRLISGIRIG